MNKITIIPNYSNFLKHNLGFEDHIQIMESVSLLRPMYSDYFKNIEAHVSVTDFNSLEDSMLLYFSNIQCIPITGRYIDTLLLKDIPLELTNSSIFFDKRCDITHDEDASYECILIQMEICKDTISNIGWYFPEKNVLLTSDWSHDSYSIALARFIKDKIIEGLNLKPINKIKVLKTKQNPKIKKSEITVGCDPEFEAFSLNERRVVYATYGDTSSEVGIDGTGECVEFRPQASTNPKEVADRLERLFSRFILNQPDTRLLCSGHKFAIGGHIHIGVNKPYAPEPELVQLLDDFLGKPFYYCSGKARSCYLGYGLYREQPWGFEYRTPPSAIFYNKKIATIALKIAKNIVYKYLSVKGKPIEYSYPPTQDDYKKYAGLNQSEYKAFTRLSETLTNLVRDKDYLIAAWKDNKNYKLGKRSRSKFIVDITKSIDTWRDECFIVIKNAIEPELKNIAKTYCSNIKLDLFGYRNDRGFVSNISISDWGMIDYNYYVTIPELRFSIGLPYSVRTVTFETADWLPDITKGIIKAIKEYFRRR